MAAMLLTRCLAGVAFARLVTSEVYFEEKFETEEWEKRWVASKWKGTNGPAGNFEWSAGNWFGDEKEQKGIRTPSNMKYHSISAKLAKPFSSKGKDLVLQFSVKHEGQESSSSFCGGGYIKLMGSAIDQENFGGPTPYKIMFGPDICGSDVARIHLIFTQDDKNLLRNEDIKLEYDDKNEYTHVYTLVVRPDNTYTVYLDLKEKASGSLHDHWDFPNKTHDDPSDKKPEKWVEEKKINDASKTKPADWVNEGRVRDPEAVQPSEWDEEEDGTWEAPMIDNPKYKGAWIVEQVDNPEYKGEWTAKQLPNPAFVEDVYAFDDIGSVGFELWTVNKGSLFDNILITDSYNVAKTEGERLKKVLEQEKEAKKAKDKASGKDAADAGAAAGGEDDDDDDEDAVEPGKDKDNVEL